MQKLYFFLFFFIPAEQFVQAQLLSRPGSIGITGDITDVQRPTRAGTVLIGGGGDVPGAFRWMIERSGGGNVVVIRASGNYLYNKVIDSLGKVQSVETLLINSRELANNDTIASILRNAEMLFISGGDQSNYMRYWRDTKTEEAINYLLNVKKVPVGGTSAGCAILTGFYFSGENGSATADALKNPYDSTVTVYNNDFLHAPFLKNIISDQHYVARKRQGRHVVFLGRIYKDFGVLANGIAPDERTAVCINEEGIATVIGEGNAYFLKPLKKPEIIEGGRNIQWSGRQKAIKVYELKGSPSGNGSFSIKNFRNASAKGGRWQWWWVEDGNLQMKAAKK